jgi:hypothetical protein
VTPWPWHAFAVDGDMPPDLASVLVASQVGPRALFFATHGKPFSGTVTDRGFVITRVIRYNNSFLPVVIGTIEPQGAGSRIRVRMRLSLYAAVFMAVWMGLVSVALVGFVVAFAIEPEGKDPIAILAPLAMFAFGWAMTTFGFWFEAGKQERMLREMFAA